MNIVCVGDCGIDHYLPCGDVFFGGITANFARNAKQAFPTEDAVQIVSAVGSDDGAELVTSSLADSGIDCHISRLSGKTPVQYIEIQSDGERKFVRYDEGVLRDFHFGVAEQQIIAHSDLMVAPVYLQIVGLFDELMSIPTKGQTAIDFADFLAHPDFDLLERHIEHIDIGFFGLSSDDNTTIAGIETLAREHGKLFVVTLGAAGSRAYHGDVRTDIAAVPVAEIVDTTGAGDAFAAGFLSRHCHGQGVKNSLAAGAELASLVIQQQGAVCDR
jgi:sugar/nucleoside kinase (ribokinase family)